MQRRLSQWFFKITDYAQRLLDDFDLLDSWPEHVVTMQRNWIGRSEGAEVTFRCEELDLDFPVFTTRPDTLFGATFFVIAPEHPDVERLVAGTEHEQAVRDYVDEAARASTEDRGAEERPKTGVPTGRVVTNPVNGEEIPVFVADYVLMDYGTGALMAVPAHDQRDWDFAKAFDLPIRPVIEPAEGEAPTDEAYTETGDQGRIVNSGEFDGLTPAEAIEKITAWLARRGQGEADGQLPPPRLADQPPALLGRADPDRPLRRVRPGPGPRGRAARSCSPTSRTTRPRERARWPPPRTGSTPSARGAARPRSATPTRWTPSSTRPGTSSATSTRTTRTRPGAATSPTTGCPSTSTSAGSSTRSST